MFIYFVNCCCIITLRNDWFKRTKVVWIINAPLYFNDLALITPSQTIKKSIFIKIYESSFKTSLCSELHNLLQKHAERGKKKPSSPDQIWSLEHDPVITLGKSADFSGILNPKGLPIVETDRGGKTTYHGPGQLVLYTIINYRRSKLSPRKLVTILEQSMIELLALKGLTGSRKDGAPGIYIDDKKIGSIGLRFGKNFSYHGMALNVNMDLSFRSDIYLWLQRPGGDSTCKL